MTPLLPSPCQAAASLQPFLCGLGLALGLGWLWFPALQVYLLPKFLWGTLFSGGGVSIFILLLCGGLTGLGLWEPKSQKIEMSHLSPWAHLRHILNFFALTMLFFISQSGNSFLGVYGPILLLVVAALTQGSHWSGALLSLSAQQVAPALTVAALAAALLSLGFSKLPGTEFWFFPAAALAAWACAVKLDKLTKTEIQTSPLSKKRGRPTIEVNCPKANSAAESVVHNISLSLLLLVASTFLGLGAFQIGEPSLSPAFEPYWAAALMGVGSLILCALAASNIFRQRDFYARNAIFISIGLALAALFFFLNIKKNIFIWLLNGLISAGIIIPLTTRPLNRAWKRGCLALASALFLSNIGATAAKLMQNITSTAHLIIGAAALICGFFWLMLGKPASTVSIKIDKKDGLENMTPAEILATLNEREQEVLVLMLKKLNNRQIGEYLNITEDSVRFHLKKIYKKTQLSNRKALIELAESLPFNSSVLAKKSSNI